MNAHEILKRLNNTLVARRQASAETSYTARLFAKGEDAILKKIGEECTELVIAGKTHVRSDIVYESADVLYHMMVLLTWNGIDIDEVLTELARREGVSGIDDKNARSAGK